MRIVTQFDSRNETHGFSHSLLQKLAEYSYYRLKRQILVILQVPTYNGLQLLTV